VLCKFPRVGELDVKIRWSLKQIILSGVVKEDKEQDFDLGFVEGQGDDPDEQHELPREELGNVAVPAFTWEASEAVAGEMINMYSPTGVIVLTAGSGSWAIACARHGVAAAVFVRSVEHKRYLDQRITATIVYEIIAGIDKGFLARRFLTRERSIAGSEPSSSRGPAAVGSAAPEEGHPPAAAAAPTAAAAVTGGAEEEDIDGSSASE
jgi:hypothetical protein